MFSNGNSQNQKSPKPDGFRGLLLSSDERKGKKRRILVFRFGFRYKLYCEIGSIKFGEDIVQYNLVFLQRVTNFIENSEKGIYKS